MNPKILIALIAIFFLSSFDSNQKNDDYRLVFEARKSMRSSFCIYSDGRFFDAQASGCVGQFFSWGYWKNINDTIQLEYSKEDIFKYDVLKSTDSQNAFQIVRIMDCYNQPVRFEVINHDSGYTKLYNTGFCKVKKGNSINYPAPMFDSKDFEFEYITCNSDTLTYKWRCNRECIESINGGRLYVNAEESKTKVILRNKRKVSL